MTEIQKRLFEMRDPSYQAFQSKLMPTVDPTRIIGVRTPALRKYAKSLFGTAEADSFLNSLPHPYYEEDQLHGFLIEQIKEFDVAMSAMEDFLSYIDNWAICDGVSPKVFAKNLDALLPHIEQWLCSEHCYTVRYGIGMLMRYYLTDGYSDAYPERVSKIKSEEYYVNMMIAWYFATALAVRFEDIVPYLTERRLSPWVHRKTIQKALESYRITEEQKRFLKLLRSNG